MQRDWPVSALFRRRYSQGLHLFDIYLEPGDRGSIWGWAHRVYSRPVRVLSRQRTAELTAQSRGIHLPARSASRERDGRAPQPFIGATAVPDSRLWIVW